MNDSIWLIGSDFHIPYENKRYMDLWWRVQKWMNPDVIDILGDLDDACPVSRYADGKPAEVIGAAATYAPLVQDFFKELRGNSPDAQIHFATGNHEARYDDYIDRKAPAISGLITPELLWKTDTYGIELSYYNNPPVHRFGDIYVHHGPYALKNSGESVRKVIDEYQVSAIVGHSHRQASVFKTYELINEVRRGYELGHMTDITSPGMGYTALHDWQPGFAVATIVNDYPHIDLVQISPDYKCVVFGKVFSA